MMIQALAQRGLSLCDMAKQVGVHPRTVRRALARGGAPAPRSSRRGSRLDPYRADIDRLVAEDVWNAVVIFRELQAKGYTGRLSILRDDIRPKRALRVKRATVRFETGPGHQLQSDWAEHRTQIAGTETTGHVVVNTLGFSRRFHFWCTDCEDAEHTYAGLIRSVEWVGGVPAEVLVDTQKAAVLAPPQGGPARFHPRFVDLAGHYGFVPRACRPARAQTKGKDERMVGYIKHHFVVRYRTFDSWAHLNQLAEQWLRDEAHRRCHGTVQEIVAEQFAREAPTRTKSTTRLRKSNEHLIPLFLQSSNHMAISEYGLGYKSCALVQIFVRLPCNNCSFEKSFILSFMNNEMMLKLLAIDRSCS
ncbi:MAG: IS21 family transposase [Nitrospira sp.]|nr:IS21 family transposase [Nitrospira sp.]